MHDAMENTVKTGPVKLPPMSVHQKGPKMASNILLCTGTSYSHNVTTLVLSHVWSQHFLCDSTKM